MSEARVAVMTSGAPTGILLSGYFGCGNLGDDLLLSAAVAELRVVAPGAHLLVRDGGQVARLPHFGSDVELTGTDTILADRSRPRAWRLVRFITRMVGLLRRCDWLVFAGGTVFHEQNGAHSLMVQWLVCRLARLAGVRIAALGVGVSDLQSSRGRWLMRDIVGHSDLFLVRDEAGRRQCGSGAARVTEDLVFGWEELLRVRRGRADKHQVGRDGIGRDQIGGGAGAARTIALTVCPPAFRGAAQERAVLALAEAVRAWQQAGHRVVFLVFYAAGGAADDRAMFETIIERLDCDRQVEIRAPTSAPQALVEAYHDIDAVCGMRFHGLVLAAMFGIPFVGVAHDNKISEICRRFDMPCLDAGTFDGMALARATMSIMEHGIDPALVERCVAQSRQNFRALAELMEKRCAAR